MKCKREGFYHKQIRNWKTKTLILKHSLPSYSLFVVSTATASHKLGSKVETQTINAYLVKILVPQSYRLSFKFRLSFYLASLYLRDTVKRQR